MNTKINIAYKGEKYTLEYDRSVIKIMEANGFNINEFLEKPMIHVNLAFQASFIKHHSKVKQTTIDEIYNSCKDKRGLIANLHKMIEECYESLLDDSEDSAEGNATWEVVDLSPKTSQK